MSENIGDFYTKKHRVLSRVSWVSGLFSWIVLILYLTISITSLVDFMDYAGMGYISDLFSFDLNLTVNLITKLIRTFFDGFVYFLVLRGVSLGLNMIIETDLNYRDQ